MNGTGQKATNVPVVSGLGAAALRTRWAKRVRMRRSSSEVVEVAVSAWVIGAPLGFDSLSGGAGVDWRVRRGAPTGLQGRSNVRQGRLGR